MSQNSEVLQQVSDLIMGGTKHTEEFSHDEGTTAEVASGWSTPMTRERRTWNKQDGRSTSRSAGLS